MQDTLLISDRELLNQYTCSGSESAFTELVRRHTNLVYSAALRQVRLEALAEDVTQSVFILLARKASQIGPKVILSGWLLRSTHYVAMDIQKSEYRRVQREQTAAQDASIASDNEPEAFWQETARHLDSLLFDMSEEDRGALALRFFENKTHCEIGEAFGISEDAAKKRVTRALEKLRSLLAKRKVTLSITALGTALAANAVQAAPQGLAEAALKSALNAIGNSMPPVANLTKPASVASSKWLRPFVGAASAVLLITLSWQSAQWFGLKAEQERLGALLAGLKTRQTTLMDEQASLALEMTKASNRLTALQPPAVVTVLTNISPRQFLWNATNDYVCVPKSLLNWVAFDGTNTHNEVAVESDQEQVINRKNGHISQTLCKVLGLTPEEEAAVQQLFESTMREYKNMCESKSYMTNASSIASLLQHGSFKATPESIAWITPFLPEEGQAWHNYLRESLEELIGQERAELILRQAFSDKSISRCFNDFGNQQVIVAAAPMTYDRCSICRYKTRDGQTISGLSFFATFKELLDAQIPGATLPEWSVLSEPLPPALIPYLKQWENDFVNQNRKVENQ